MCIKIVRNKETVEYDMQLPLEDQIKGSKQIVVDYRPEDPSIEKFMDEIERLLQSGISAHLNIKVLHNNTISGARVKRKTSDIVSGVNFNEVIKLMTLVQSVADTRIDELLSLTKDKSK